MRWMAQSMAWLGGAWATVSGLLLYNILGEKVPDARRDESDVSRCPTGNRHNHHRRTNQHQRRNLASSIDAAITILLLDGVHLRYYCGGLSYLHYRRAHPNTNT